MAKTVIRLLVTCEDHDTTKWAAKKMAECMNDLMQDERVEATLSVNNRGKDLARQADEAAELDEEFRRWLELHGFNPEAEIDYGKQYDQFLDERYEGGGQ